MPYEFAVYISSVLASDELTGIAWYQTVPDHTWFCQVLLQKIASSLVETKDIGEIRRLRYDYIWRYYYRCSAGLGSIHCLRILLWLIALLFVQSEAQLAPPNAYRIHALCIEVRSCQFRSKTQKGAVTLACSSGRTQVVSDVAKLFEDE